MPPMAKMTCPKPERRPAASEPEPGSARFVVKQPQAVWRLSGRRGPSAKEIFIGIHHRAHREWQIEQKNEFGQQDQGNACFGQLSEHPDHSLEIKAAAG